MKDTLGRKIKVGDIVAHGQRSGNGGYLGVKVVTDLRKTPNRWREGEFNEEVHVKGYTERRWEWNNETKKGEFLDGMFLEKGGWTSGDRVVVITESVPVKLKKFLQKGL